MENPKSIFSNVIDKSSASVARTANARQRPCPKFSCTDAGISAGLYSEKAACYCWLQSFWAGFRISAYLSDTGTFTESPLGHLLVVDDDREIREILNRFLSKQGYRVSVAADGVEMQQVPSDRKIELVIPDLMLPVEDGLSICRDLRAYSQVPIVMLTVVGEESQRS